MRTLWFISAAQTVRELHRSGHASGLLSARQKRHIQRALREMRLTRETGLLSSTLDAHSREAVATNFVGTNRTSRTRPTRNARERELAGWSEVSAPSARARPEYLVLSGFHDLILSVRARARGCPTYLGVQRPCGPIAGPRPAGPSGSLTARCGLLDQASGVPAPSRPWQKR